MSKVLEIELVEGIGGWNFRLPDLMAQVKSAKKVDEVHIPINSYGGEVTEGLAIYNYIKGLSPKTTANVVGYAMSMGTVVVQAADHRTMPKNSYFMIHNPWTFAMGDDKDMKGVAATLESMKLMLADIYTERSTLSTEEALELMDAETWLSATEALEYGLIDEVTEAATFQASFDPSKYSNVPKALAKSQVKNMNPEKKGVVARVKSFFESNAHHFEEADTLEEISAKMVAKTKEVETLTADKASIQAKLDTVNANLAAKDTEITDLQGQITALTAKIAELEKQPAGSHSETGEEPPAAPEGEKSYNQDPITQRAFGFFKSNKK